MSKTIGIPRGLFYYKYFPLWKTFFEKLGVRVIVSDPTSKQILDMGVKSCVDEACLPVKLFHGHVLNLKGKVDYIFIPRFTSISRNEYICPKFGGLPDMIRHTLDGLPEIIDTEVNLRKSKNNAIKAFYEVGAHFTSEAHLIKKAYGEAIKSHREYRRLITEGHLPCDLLEGKRAERQEGMEGSRLKIAVVGHPYNLYDSHLNMNMVKKLKRENVEVITVDMVDEAVVNEKVRDMPKRLFWNFGRRAVGGAMHFLDDEELDGIIYLMSFGCGVDSFVCDIIERKVRRKSSIPFMVLTLDEHSGEAGLNTRLEAYIDMIRWRNANEGNLPAYG